jgi:UDP-N-acetylglucosamine 1-carboxyvinyltransferase
MAKMGAKVDVEGRTAVITGVDRLTGSDVEATDLRAGAALIVAALAAQGRSRVFHTEHVERGYEGIVEKLSTLGATIWREDENGRRVGGEALSLCA